MTCTGPGSPVYRLSMLLSELAIRFPNTYDPISSRACEPKFLDAIDGLKAENVRLRTALAKPCLNCGYKQKQIVPAEGNDDQNGNG